MQRFKRFFDTQRAVEFLLKRNEDFHTPTRGERDALLVGFAMKRQVLYGAAFDFVRHSGAVDLTEPASIAACLDRIVVYEIKSTYKPSTEPDFSGYVFNLTTAKLLIWPEPRSALPLRLRQYPERLLDREEPASRTNIRKICAILQITLSSMDRARARA